MTRSLITRILAFVSVVTMGAVLLAAPASAAVNSCSGGGGTFWGSNYGTLDNGELRVGWCVENGTSIVRQVNVEYAKSGGGSISVKFGWSMVNNEDATATYATWLEPTARTISSGQTQTYSFTYPTASPAAVSRDWQCARGVMQAQVSLVLYITKTVCS